MRALFLLCAEPSRLGAKTYPSGNHFSSRWLFRLRRFSRSFSLRLRLGPSAVDFVFLSLLFLGLPLDVLVLLDVFGRELNAGGLPAEHILHRMGQQNVRRGGGCEKLKCKYCCELLVRTAVLLAVRTAVHQVLQAGLRSINSRLHSPHGCEYYTNKSAYVS